MLLFSSRLQQSTGWTLVLMASRYPTSLLPPALLSGRTCELSSKATAPTTPRRGTYWLFFGFALTQSVQENNVLAKFNFAYKDGKSNFEHWHDLYKQCFLKYLVSSEAKFGVFLALEFQKNEMSADRVVFPERRWRLKAFQCCRGVWVGVWERLP